MKYFLIASFLWLSGTLIPSQEEISRGKASYYADKFEGRLTASGEPYKASALTAAHRTLPFGTLVKVTNVKNDKSVIVRINDRGPHVKGRIIDVSRSAAEILGIIREGIATVTVEVVPEGSGE